MGGQCGNGPSGGFPGSQNGLVPAQNAQGGRLLPGGPPALPLTFVDFEEQLATRAATPRPQPPQRPSQVGSIVILLVGTGLMVLFAMWVWSWGNNPVSDAPEGEVASYTTVPVASFANRLADPESFVINVHVPYEGEIEGTDAFIPYNEIKGDDRLPADKGTEILIYCRSGRMSAEAGDTLVDLGYTNVYELGGGMNAWKESGREILEKAQS